jgi:hypothetical protein
LFLIWIKHCTLFNIKCNQITTTRPAPDTNNQKQGWSFSIKLIQLNAKTRKMRIKDGTMIVIFEQIYYRQNQENTSTQSTLHTIQEHTVWAVAVEI